jgi:hypothetical protein
MAATYLHNALYARNPSDHRDMLEHARNLSTISTATALTNTTHHSQLTDPLLQSVAPREATESYFDEITRQPRNLDVTPARLQWGDSLTPETDPVVVGEKGKGRGRENGKRWKKVKWILEAVMGVCFSLLYSLVSRLYFCLTLASGTMSCCLKCCLKCC